MAVVKLTLPKCDVCGEVTLPSSDAAHNGVRARDDIRAYDEARRADKLPPYRCGKCKSPRWDRAFTGDRRRKKQQTKQVASEPQTETTVPETVQNGRGLEDLYGILKDVYASFGGGEAYLKAERDWGPDVWERYEAEERQRMGKQK